MAAKQPTWARAQTMSNVVGWIGNVDRRQRDIGVDENGDAAVVDRHVVSCMRSRMIDDVRPIHTAHVNGR